MDEILLVSAEPENLADFATGLEQAGNVHLSFATSAAAAIESIEARSPRLVVLDETIGKVSPLRLVVDLMRVNAMINTVVLSSLSPTDFHEAAEGLGVMAQLPPRADSAAAAAILRKLEAMPSY